VLVGLKIIITTITTTTTIVLSDLHTSMQLVRVLFISFCVFKFIFTASVEAGVVLTIVPVGPWERAPAARGPRSIAKFLPRCFDV